MSSLLLRWLAPRGDEYNRVVLVWRAWPSWLLLLAAAALAAALGMGIVTAHRAAPRSRLRLATLRLASAAILLVFLLGPALELQQAERLARRVAILLDTSKSMTLPAGGGTRFGIARDLASDLVRSLGREATVEVFGFDAGVRPVGAGSLAGLTADGARTDLSQGLAAPAREGADAELAATILLSDGIDTERLGQVADFARHRPDWPEVPVFPVRVADNRGLPDLALVDLRHEPLGFVRHDLSFDVTLKAQGFAGRQAEVTLFQDRAVVQSRTVDLPGDQVLEPLHFRLRPDRPGTYLYTIKVTPLAGEAVVSNNQIEFPVQVERDQVRVLLICGRPSWDERFLRQMLKSDPNVDLVSFFILRDENDDPGVSQDELSLIPFPVNDLFTTELENFDVVILQNFSRGFSRLLTLTQLHLDNLREWVMKRGGGLMLVGGDLGQVGGGYQGTAIEDVLPFALGGQGPEVDEGSFRPVLTEAGGRHFVTALEPEALATRGRFESLPALDGTEVVGPLKPSSLALLVHPRLSAGGQPMPVLAARSAGKGRVLALTVDTTWYWGFRELGQGGTNRTYLRFWQNSLRWLSQDPGSKFLSLSVGRPTVEPGEPETVRVRALGGDYAAFPGAHLRLAVAPVGEAAAPPETHDGVTDAAGAYDLEVRRDPEGFYQAMVELIDASGAVLDRDRRLFEVRADRTEFEDPAPRPELLEAVAKATGGRVLGPDEARSFRLPGTDAYRLGARRRVELWDSAWLYAALLLTLLGEWWTRRRLGLP